MFVCRIEWCLHIYLLLFDQCEIIKIRMITIVLHRMATTAKKNPQFFLLSFCVHHPSLGWKILIKKTPHLCADWFLKKKFIAKWCCHTHTHTCLWISKKNKQTNNNGIVSNFFTVNDDDDYTLHITFQSMISSISICRNNKKKRKNLIEKNKCIFIVMCLCSLISINRLFTPFNWQWLGQIFFCFVSVFCFSHHQFLKLGTKQTNKQTNWGCLSIKIKKKKK